MKQSSLTKIVSLATKAELICYEVKELAQATAQNAVVKTLFYNTAMSLFIGVIRRAH
jgi:choline kinase